MSNNQVVIYSNGIADFQRCYQVSSDAAKRISIPVRQDHLADVLASFNVYGDVKLDSPPTFRPSNELEGNITINPHQVLEDLATSLSGARVRLERASGAIEGTLVGMHQEQEATSGEPIQPKSIIVLADDGLRRSALREVQSFQFLDEDVQTEIDKALQRNYQRIKPNSTFVEMVLSTVEKETDAVVQYTIPAAAWKISYRLRMVEGRTTELQGFAIVDNNTDEDWTDFHVCVVTGEPITFSTDLAESKTPDRNHVNLVSEFALGAVEVESAIPMAAAMGGMADADEDAPTRGARRMRKLSTTFGRTDLAEMQSAQTSASEVHEVGDFSVFESDSLVSIPAKRSTVIPVFNVEVAESKSVLHYKFENHDTRPYRSVDFHNQTDFSIGRGVCTVYEEAAYAGNCIVPALKPGESGLLPHALETGVLVHREKKRLRNKVVALRLSEGFCYTSMRQRRETHYKIRNSRDRAYEFVLDHTFTIAQPKLSARLVQQESDEELNVADQLADGVRFSVKVEAKSDLMIKIAEERIEQTQIELVHVSKQQDQFEIEWLERNLVKTNGPLAKEPGVLACLEIHQELESKRQEKADAISEVERLAARQTRLRENISSGGQDELTSRWRAELDEAEQAIRAIEEQRLPQLREEEKSLRGRLRETLKTLSAEWSGEV